jgi:hypothetical protein
MFPGTLTVADKPHPKRICRLCFKPAPDERTICLQTYNAGKWQSLHFHVNCFTTAVSNLPQ